MNSQATDPELAVPFPPSVDELLRKICTEQSLRPVDADVRRRLAERGELGALEILRKVDSTKVRVSLGGLIIYLLEHYPLTPSPRMKTRVNSVAESQSPKRTRSCSIDVNASIEREVKEVKEALGELEFRKQFLILNYIGG